MSLAHLVDGPAEMLMGYLEDRESFEKYRSALIKPILKDPFLIDYTSHPDWRTNVLSMSKPEDVLAFMRFAVVGIAETGLTETRAHRLSMLGTITSIAIAQPYVWQGNLASEALRKGLPKDLIVGPETLGVEVGANIYLHLFPNPQEAVAEGERSLVYGLVWMVEHSSNKEDPRPRLVAHTIMMQNSKWRVWTSVTILPAALDDTDTPGEGRSILASVTAFASFANSPWIPKESRPVTRALRRRIERKTQQSLPSVTFIDLRKIIVKEETEEPTEEATATGSEKTRTYRYRWIVRGHHRAQWYAKAQCHKLIWIAPHIRGPASAPMLEHVFRVKR